MAKINKHLFHKDLTKWQKKEAQELADTLDNEWAYLGKNFKRLTGDLEKMWEIRWRDGLRVVFEWATREIEFVFKKKWHETTDNYL